MSIEGNGSAFISDLESPHPPALRTNELFAVIARSNVIHNTRRETHIIFSTELHEYEGTIHRATLSTIDNSDEDPTRERV